MKRKPIFLALVLLLVIGAALLSSTYQTNYPPLSAADKDFLSIVAGADATEIIQDSCQERPDCENGREIVSRKLTAAQTRSLIDPFRFLDTKPKRLKGRRPQGTILYIRFLQKGRAAKTVHFTLFQTVDSAFMYSPEHLSKVFILNPRFNKRLNRTLDAYLPQRIRP